MRGGEGRVRGVCRMSCVVCRGVVVDDDDDDDDECV